MSCDHVIGTHGANNIRHSRWVSALGEFAAAVHFYNTTQSTVAHPGYMVAHAHCLDCGAQLDVGAARASISEAISVAVDAAIGSDTLTPVRSGLTRRTYTEWLAASARVTGFARST